MLLDLALVALLAVPAVSIVRSFDPKLWRSVGCRAIGSDGMRADGSVEPALRGGGRGGVGAAADGSADYENYR